MLQQQLQLQKSLPIDDMKAAETSVKSNDSSQSRDSSKQFESALNRSTTEQNKPEIQEPRRAKAANRAEHNERAERKLDDKRTVEPRESNVQRAEPSNRTESTSNQSETTTEAKVHSEVVKEGGEQSSKEQNSAFEGQVTAASEYDELNLDDMQQELQAMIAQLEVKLDGQVNTEQLQALAEKLSKLSDALELQPLTKDTGVDVAKLEMALTKLSEVLDQVKQADADVETMGTKDSELVALQQQLASLKEQLKQDLDSKSAALDAVTAELNAENEQTAWLETIAALMNGDSVEKQNKDPDVIPQEGRVKEQSEKPLALYIHQEPVKVDVQQLSQSPIEIKVSADKLTTVDKVVFEPLSQSLIKQINDSQIALKGDASQGAAIQGVDWQASSEAGKIGSGTADAELAKMTAAMADVDKVDKSKPEAVATVKLNSGDVPESNTTFKALAQMNINNGGAQNPVSEDTISTAQNPQSAEFSKDKILAELNQTTTMLRTPTAQLASTDAEAPVVKTQVEVQGVQLDKTLVQPKLESIQNAKQEGMLRENILFNKNELANNLHQQVGMMLARNMKSVDIRLDPPELGSIQVRLSVSNEQAAVSFVVSTQQAKDALEGSMSKLKEMLEQEGLNLADTDVKQESGGKEQGETDNADDDIAANGFEDDNVEVTDPVLAEKVRQINSPWNVDFYA